MDEADSARGRAAAVYLLLLCTVGGLFLLHNRLSYSSDSWSLYELSRTVSNDFYSVRHIRNYEQVGSYSSSFPPLWPILVALADQITGLGAKSGFFLAVLSSLMFALSSEHAGRILFGIRWIGLAAAALVFGHSGYWGEVIAGRTIPLQLSFYAISISIATARPLTARAGALVGLVMGAAVLNRFDALPAAIALPFLALILRPLPRFFPAYLVSLLIASAPWILYSWHRFGTIFKSDNSSVALSAKQRHIADWYLYAPPTLFDDPLSWIGKIALNAVMALVSIVGSPGPRGWAASVLVVGGLVIGMALLKQAKDPSRSGVGSTQWRRLRRRKVIFAILLMSMLLPSYIVTGYFDPRYFAPLWWVFLLTLFGFLLNSIPASRRDSAAFFTAGGALLFAAVLSVVKPFLQTAPHVGFPIAADDARVRECLPADPRRNVILHSNSAEAARYSALYGWRTVQMPGNLENVDPVSNGSFLKRHDVRFVAIEPGRDLPMLLEAGQLVPIPNCPAGWYRSRLR